MRGIQRLIDGDGGQGRIAGRTPRFDSALRACRPPYIPLLISHCRPALSLSGTRLTLSLTAAACLDNPDQEVLETSTSSTPLGLRGVVGLRRIYNLRKSKLTALKKRHVYL